jgi:UPF0755 protein
MGTRALAMVAGLAMLVALAGVAVIAGWSQLNAYLTRPGPAATETVVVLSRGSSLGAITDSLIAARVIDHPWLFRIAVRSSGHDRDLQAGEYAFPPRVTPESVIGMLAAGETVARRITVTEGMTTAEVFRLLDGTAGLSGELPPPPAEGSLLPETYFFALGDDRAALVRRMQKAMTAVIEELWPERASDLPFARREEAVILASIIDKETARAAERDVVAAVFVNRLRQGMRLQSDPTVIYGLTGGDGPLGRALNRKDWKHDSPYNTYVIDRLPPGPIGNPGRASIEAVLAPAAVDYLFFVADGTGGHAFARTLDEHNRNVAQWRRIKNGHAPRPVAPTPPKPAG